MLCWLNVGVCLLFCVFVEGGDFAECRDRFLVVFGERSHFFESFVTALHAGHAGFDKGPVCGCFGVFCAAASVAGDDVHPVEESVAQHAFGKVVIVFDEADAFVERVVCVIEKCAVLAQDRRPVRDGAGHVVVFSAVDPLVGEFAPARVESCVGVFAAADRTGLHAFPGVTAILCRDE